jgi:hypothetical protein
MGLISCLKVSKLSFKEKEIQSQIDALVKEGMTLERAEAQVKAKFIKEAYSKLETQLNEIKAQLGIEEIEVGSMIEADFNAADQKYQSTLNELANLEQANIVETVVEEVTQPDPKEIEKIEEEYTKKIDALRPPQNKQTQLQLLQNKLRDILNSNSYVLEYFGDDVENRQEPTQEEIQEYQDLQEQIIYGQEQNILYNDAANFTKEITGISKEQIERYQELNQKLNDWKTLDGSVIEGQDSSIADLLKIIHALKQQVAKDDTKTNFSEEEYNIIVKEETQEWGSSPSTVKSPDNVLSYTYTDKEGVNQVSFSFLSIAKLASLFPGAQINIKIGNDFEIYDETKHVKLSKKKGIEFVIFQGENILPIEVGQNSRLLIPQEALQAADSNITVLSIGVKNNNMVFETLENGDLQMLEADFSFTDVEGKDTTLAVDKLNSMQKGDTVEMKIDREDSYNAMLIKEYNANKEKDPIGALNKLENNLSIYIYPQGSVELLGNLAAIEGANSSNIDQNKAVRKEAVARLLDEKNKDQRYVNTGQTATVGALLLGSPNIGAKTSENGPEVKTIPFTKEALQNVKATGFMKDENTTISNKLEDVNYTYVKALARNRKLEKIPFIVIEYQGKNIAFPIKMNITEESKLEELTEILNTKLSPDQKALKVIELMQQNGISPDSYNIDFSNTNWQTSEELLQLAEALDNQLTFVTAEDLASENFDVDRLLTEAEVAVDVADKPFRAGKMILKLKDVVLEDPKTAKEASRLESIAVEDELSTIAQEIDIEQTNNVNQFEGVEDDPFTQTWADAVELEKNSGVYIRKVSYSNTLRAALDTLKSTKGFKKGQREAIKAAIGEERLAKIEKLFAKRDTLIKFQNITVKGNLADQVNTVKNNCP